MRETSLTDFTPPGLLAWLHALGIDCEVLAPGLPMPTVPLAAAAIGVTVDEIAKTLLFEDRSGRHVRVIARGEDRIDAALLAEHANLDRPRLAKPATVLDILGWPAGGVSPVGLRTPVPTIIDTGITVCGMVYGGAGTHDTLLRIRPSDILALTCGTVASLIAER